MDGWTERPADGPRQHFSYVEHADLQRTLVWFIVDQTLDEEHHDHTGESQRDREDAHHLQVMWMARYSHMLSSEVLS